MGVTESWWAAQSRNEVLFKKENKFARNIELVDASGISQVHIIFRVYCPNPHKLPFHSGNGSKIEWVLN